MYSIKALKNIGICFNCVSTEYISNQNMNLYTYNQNFYYMYEKIINLHELLILIYIDSKVYLFMKCSFFQHFHLFCCESRDSSISRIQLTCTPFNKIIHISVVQPFSFTTVINQKKLDI